MRSVALRGIIIGGNTGSHARLGPAPAHSATGFGRRSLRAACCRVSAPTCQSGSSPAGMRPGRCARSRSTASLWGSAAWPASACADPPPPDAPQPPLPTLPVTARCAGCGPSRRAPPWSTRRQPLALAQPRPPPAHAQVRVHGDGGVGTHEQVLAARHSAGDALPRQVRGRESLIARRRRDGAFSG
jgi:hypothetical protein